MKQTKPASVLELRSLSPVSLDIADLARTTLVDNEPEPWGIGAGSKCRQWSAD